jgi:UDP-N-acetylmuramate--alanine ligase
MSGIARVLLQRGIAVSGSDLGDGRVASELRGLGARVESGHRPEHLGGADLVVVSTAVAADNPEVLAARAAGLPVRSRAEMLADLVGDDRGVFVAGTHGKTTTTSMLVVASQAAGLDPTFVIGGSLNESGTNAHAGADAVVVAEADESDRSFLAYTPDIAMVTNVEFDHPEQYRDTEDVLEAFEAFLSRRRPGGIAIVCIDDAGVRRLAARVTGPLVRYGTSADADVRLMLEPRPRVRIRGTMFDLDLAVPGTHNALNATAALAAVDALGLDLARAAQGLGAFTGAARRFQRLGTAGGVSVVDDYAHHPTELRATLAAARSVARGEVVLVLQPHRYSRTAALGEELGRAAAGADRVIVTDVYGAGEPTVPGVTGRTVADAALAAGADVTYVAHLDEVVAAVLERAHPGDLVLVAGAGDVTQIGPALLERLGAP